MEIRGQTSLSRCCRMSGIPFGPWHFLQDMRNGELYVLEWGDVDFENSLIRVSKSYNSRLKIVKYTKA